MKKNIIIFGSGTHSIMIFSEIIKLKDYNFLGFVDDFSKKKKIVSYKKKSFFNLGGIEDVIKIKKSKRKLCGIIGVGFNYNRKKIFNKVVKLDKNFKWESIVSKDCILNNNVSIGEGSLIMSGVIINTQTIIGKHCYISTSSSIGSKNNFMNFSSCGPRTVTGGNVTLGENSYIGIGSSVKHKIRIERDTVVGGGSFVNKKCEKESLYYGVPIKKIRNRKISENYF